MGQTPTQPSETKLAKTGTTRIPALVLIPPIAVFGAIIYFASRKEDI